MEYLLRCNSSWHAQEVLEPNASDETADLLNKSTNDVTEVTTVKEEPEDVEYSHMSKLQSQLQSDVQGIVKVEPSDFWDNHPIINKAPQDEPTDDSEMCVDELMRDNNCVCNVCGEQFPTTDDVVIHLSTHVGDANDRPSYQCLQCDKSFTSKSGLWRHAKKHTEDPAHACTLCDKTFARKSTLQKHFETHAREQDKFEIKCEICNRPFDCQYNFERHMKIHSTKDPNENSCEFCGKKFSNKSNLKTHMKKHAETTAVLFDETSALQALPPVDDRAFKCDGCDKTFKSKHYLKEHARIHLETNPYKCVICEKQLSCKANLMVHVRTHVRKGTTAANNATDMFEMMLGEVVELN